MLMPLGVLGIAACAVLFVFVVVMPRIIFYLRYCYGCVLFSGLGGLLVCCL